MGFAHDVLTSKERRKRLAAALLMTAGPRDRVREFISIGSEPALFFRACLQHDRSPPVDRAHCGRTGHGLPFPCRLRAIHLTYESRSCAMFFLLVGGGPSHQLARFFLLSREFVVFFRCFLALGFLLHVLVLAAACL